MKNHIHLCISLISFGFVIAGAVVQSASIIPSRFRPCELFSKGNSRVTIATLGRLVDAA